MASLERIHGHHETQRQDAKYRYRIHSTLPSRSVRAARPCPEYAQLRFRRFSVALRFARLQSFIGFTPDPPNQRQTC